MNLDQIVDLAREYLDEDVEDSVTGDYPTESIVKAVNQEHRHLFSLVRRSYEDFFGREYIFPVNPNQFNYDVPRDMLSIRRVEMLPSSMVTPTELVNPFIGNNMTTYVVDETQRKALEISKIGLNDLQEGVYMDYNNNRMRSQEGYTMWQDKIKFGDGVDLSTGNYCRIFYIPIAPDLHSGDCNFDTLDVMLLSTPGDEATVGPVEAQIDQYYQGCYFEITQGGGTGGRKKVVNHNGSGGVVYFDSPFTGNFVNPSEPTEGSRYSMVSPIPEDFHEMLAYGAVIRLKGIKTEDDTSVVSELYLALRDDLRKMLEDRVQQRSRRVRNRGSVSWY